MSENVGIEEPVTLATFSFISEALVLRSRLEHEGIPCFIPEEHTASIIPYSTAMKIRILVDRKDLEQASLILKDTQADVGGEGGMTITPSKCPNCGSEKTRHSASSFSNFFRAIFGLFMMVPMRRKAAEEQCFACGWKWRAQD